MSTFLTESEIEEKVNALNVGWWHIPAQGLVRVFTTNSFADGMALTAKVAAVAEQLQHFPQVDLQHDQVEVTITSDDSGNLTQLDIDFAEAVDRQTA
jgi:4a-hydroxytetrahydrobiopterin dehydratase